MTRRCQNPTCGKLYDTGSAGTDTSCPVCLGLFTQIQSQQVGAKVQAQQPKPPAVDHKVRDLLDELRLAEAELVVRQNQFARAVERVSGAIDQLRAELEERRVV